MIANTWMWNQGVTSTPIRTLSLAHPMSPRNPTLAALDRLPGHPTLTSMEDICIMLGDVLIKSRRQSNDMNTIQDYAEIHMAQRRQQDGIGKRTKAEGQQKVCKTVARRHWGKQIQHLNEIVGSTKQARSSVNIRKYSDLIVATKNARMWLFVPLKNA